MTEPREPTPEPREREWTNVNQVMELVKQEGDVNCERAFDFLVSIARGEQHAREEERAAHEGLAWCLDEVRDRLAALGCSHGHNHSKTPPMMYPEWIGCVLAHHTKTFQAERDAALRLVAEAREACASYLERQARDKDAVGRAAYRSAAADLRARDPAKTPNGGEVRA